MAAVRSSVAPNERRPAKSQQAAEEGALIALRDCRSRQRYRSNSRLLIAVGAADLHAKQLAANKSLWRTDSSKRNTPPNDQRRRANHSSQVSQLEPTGAFQLLLYGLSSRATHRAATSGRRLLETGRLADVIVRHITRQLPT